MALNLSTSGFVLLSVFLAVCYSAVINDHSQDALITRGENFVGEKEGGNTTEGDHCESILFPCSDKILGNMVLVCFYGAILGFAAKLISEGAEMLLDLDLKPAIIGGVVLPVMGAVPDSMMIIFSGLGGDKETAQNQISVGMGTLAGSTILLLTVAWGVSLLVGRTDVLTAHNGKVTTAEGTCTGFSLTRQGVQPSKQVMFVAIGMVATGLPYLIVQASDWKFGARKVHVVQPEYVRTAALITMIICFVLFVAYLISQIWASNNDEDAKVNVLLRIRRRKMMAHAAYKFIGFGNGNVEEDPMFHTIDAEDIRKRRVARNLGRLWRMKARAAAQARSSDFSSQELSDNRPLVQNEEGSQHEEEEPKWVIAIGSAVRLIGGVGLVTVFSDPMCDVLSALTNKDYAEHLPIPAFYVSFVVTPLCSNASELVSSILLAMQKEKDKINMTYSQIYGACIMNNTLCLGVFCALIYFRDLEWYFSAEVTVILLFELLFGLTAVVFRLGVPVCPTYLGFIAIALYPISLGMVFFMENVLNWG